MKCVDFDLIVPIPNADGEIQIEYLFENLRAYTIGRRFKEKLKVFVPEPWNFRHKDAIAPQEIDLIFENRASIRPHRVRFMDTPAEYEIIARVKCVHCGATGRYYGDLDEEPGPFGRDGVRLVVPKLDYTKEWDVAGDVEWDAKVTLVP